MKQQINFNETSTWRGLVWVIGGLIALAFLGFSCKEDAMTAISITATVAGGIGVLITDKPE